MKLPINIDDLMAMWSEDAKIDETEPGRALLDISKIHAKYLKVLTHHNLVVKKLTSDYNKLRKLKWEYYCGDLNNPEDLETYGLPPMTKKVLRADIPIYLDGDTELNNLLLKKALNEEIADFAKAVIKELNNRTWQIRSHIDYERFIGGQ